MTSAEKPRKPAPPGGDPDISGPTDVRARRGDRTFAVKQLPRRDGDGPESGAPDPREPQTAPMYRASSEAEAQPGGGAGDGDGGHHLAAPTIAAVPLPGIDPKLDTEHPYQAVVAYEKYTGKLLQDAQRHDQRIESYARFVETDHIRLAKLHAEYQQLGDSAKNAKKRKEMEDAVGAKKAPAEARAAVWAVAFEIAEERSRLAQAARLDADEDVPMIDGVYERARDAKKEVFEQTGGRSPAYTDARRREQYVKYAAEQEKQSAAVAAGGKRKEPAKLAASLSKHRKRGRLAGDAIATATSLGVAVREAKLSEGRLFVKVSELDSHKKSIEEAVSTGDWWSAKAKWIGKKGASAAVGVLTAGLGATQDTGPLGDEKLGMKTTWLWDRLRDDIDKIIILDDKKPYGRATTFHMGLQLYNALLREARNVIAGVATLCGILGAAVALFAPPVAVVLKAIAVALGLIALGLTAVKLVIDAVLATWTAIQRAVTSNARNKNLLNAQGRGQGAELLADSVSMGAAFGAPALANAGALGQHGSSHFLMPWQQATGTGYAASVAQSGGTGWGDVGQVAATKVLPQVGKIGVKALNEGAVTDEMGNEMAKHRAAPRPTVPSPTQHRPPGPGPGQEPGWLKTARAGEQATLLGSIESLVSKHNSQRAAFHDKTQALMKHLWSVGVSAKQARGGLDAAKRKDDDGTLAVSQGMASGLGDVTSRLGASAAALTPKDLVEVGVVGGG